jgi:hypothetical protein
MKMARHEFRNVNGLVQMVIDAEDYELPGLGAPSSPVAILRLWRTAPNLVAKTQVATLEWNGAKWVPIPEASTEKDAIPDGPTSVPAAGGQEPDAQAGA